MSANQHLTQDLPMFRLGRTSMFRGADAQRTDDFVIKVANGQRGHDIPSLTYVVIDSI